MVRVSSILIGSLAVAVALGSSYSAPIFAKDRGGDTTASASKTERPKRAARKAQDEARAPKVFNVGPGQEYQRPSDVQRVVRSGDTVEIAPGTYVDCVLWPKQLDGLTIEGKDVIMQDKTCGDKGIFVVSSDNVTIRGITFKGAKVKDNNGAGIRAQGRNLTIENSRFIDNQNGVLGSGVAGGTITIRNSFFQGNGVCIAQCAHGVYISRVALLRIENSEFVGQHAGHHIKSRALATELIDNTIHDGPTGDASYLIDIPNGGNVLISGNTLEKGPKTVNRLTVIRIGEDTKTPLNPTSEIRIENNTFANDVGKATTFVRNETPTAAVLRGNKLQGGQVTAVSGVGSAN